MKKIVGICFSLLLALNVFALNTMAQNQSVSLEWDSSCNTNVVGYRVYWTTNLLSVPLTNIIQNAVDDCGILRTTTTNVYYGVYVSRYSIDTTTPFCTISNLVKGTTYYFTVTAKSQSLESDKSEEVKFIVPLFPPNVPPSRVQGFRRAN